jgi:hypothetical protein
MKPGLKYLLILISVSALGSGLLILLGNTQPNVEVVVHNQSGQPLSSIRLQTEKSKRDVVLRGIDVGTEAVIKFHNDGEDTFFLLVRFADGKEIKGESVPFAPGWRVVETVTDKNIISNKDPSLTLAN